VKALRNSHEISDSIESMEVSDQLGNYKGSYGQLQLLKPSL
jgi:hypothetical protein